MLFTLIRRFIEAVLLVLCLFLSGFVGPVTEAATLDYTEPTNWAYWQQGPEKFTDCFLICPTVFLGGEGQYNLSLANKQSQELQAFVGALNMERGIYDASCTMYAPFYQQISLAVYKLPERQRESYLQLAYADVREAFQAYLKQSKKPFVLAGFSQGADMCIRLLKEFGKDETVAKRLVACYAIGWRVTEAELKAHPWLKMAKSAMDIGVIVSFNSESSAVQDSLLVPKGSKTKAINPLTWRTDNNYASALHNKGACFTDYSANIKKEEPYFCGAWLDAERGTLKINSKITPKAYPPVLDIFTDGVYHLYDYQFFYRNLQENVALRTSAYCNKL
ncbi:MAG: DUF3089 domain-containing protein [Phascolarctobacterium sp.]